MKVTFFKVEDWAQDYLKNKLSTMSGLEAEFIDDILDEDHIPAVNTAEVVSVFVDSKMPAGVIDKFPNLKLIATRSTGFDHIDVSSANTKNIAVTSVPAYGANTVAEYAFALLLALSRHIPTAYERLRETGAFDYNGLRGFDLKDKTIGIVGTGNIGKFAIKIAKGFGMNILASDPYPNESLAKELDFKYVELGELLANSNVISLHVPYMNATHHLLNAQNIPTIKKGAVVINTSRGAVIETLALAKALDNGGLSGAALDVLEEEGVIKDELHFLLENSEQEHNLKTVLANHILIDMPNVLVTPHNAFNTQEALERILDTTLENISSFMSGSPTNVVKLPNT